MTYGTAKVYKTSTRKDGTITLGIIVPVDVVTNEKIEPGCRVQFDMSRLVNIPATPAIHGEKLREYQKKKKEEQSEEDSTSLGEVKQ